MLDFYDKIYQKIFNLGEKYNIVANCREYPALSLNKQPFNLAKIRKFLQEKFRNPELTCGLYVHFPFCQSRCAFCKYYSEIVFHKDKDTVFNKYLDALENELKCYETDFSKVKLDNICLGGGTPTLLNEQQIEQCLSIIYRFFRFKPGAQISIEGTPETITLAKVKEYRKLGINRVSLGLQSLNDDILRRMGRRHTVKDVFKSFDAIRQGGINYISADIIWGLPGESAATYKKTINTVIKLLPEFVEGFLLTTGGRVKIQRFYPPGVNLDKIIKEHKEIFVSSGYRIHSWGNFLGVIKKGTRESMAVNQNMDELYNCRAAVLGVGAGSSSHFNNLKYKIVSNFKTYSSNLEKNNFLNFYGIKLTQDDYKRQYIISRIGFFRNIKKNDYWALFGKGLAEDFFKEIIYLKNRGIIRETPTRYEWLLTEKEMGHTAFFEHVIRYWYHPKYIRQILELE